jgi:hypothetical protein
MCRRLYVHASTIAIVEYHLVWLMCQVKAEDADLQSCPVFGSIHSFISSPNLQALSSYTTFKSIIHPFSRYDKVVSWQRSS